MTAPRRVWFHCSIVTIFSSNRNTCKYAKKIVI